jgi:DNA-binding response OmpR family regulator
MIKLLLVEDDVNLVYIIKSSFEIIIGGYEVKTAANGAEGLACLKEFHPDIIVSDIEMPVMNGLEMVKKIRQTDKDIPIVFTTGKMMPKDVTAGYEAGVNNYIKKPFMPEELDAHIKALINLKNETKIRTKSDLYPDREIRVQPEKLYADVQTLRKRDIDINRPRIRNPRITVDQQSGDCQKRAYP